MYVDDGTYPGNGTTQDDVTVTVDLKDDDQGQADPQTRRATVKNVAPDIKQLTLLPTRVDEGSSVQLRVVFEDPGRQDVHTLSVDWGDGTPVETLRLPTGVREYTRQHKYLDDGRSPGNGTVADSYTVTALITDDDLDEDQDQARVTVVNVGPGLSLTPSAAIIDEGQSWTLQIELDEPGILDEHELFVDWGDGQSQVIHLPAGQTTASLAHTYVDDNPTGTPQDTYSILVEVTDDDLGYSVADAVVEVRNVPPAIALTLSQAVIQEGDDVLLTGTIQDPGVEDSFSVLIDWGGTQGSETLEVAGGHADLLRPPPVSRRWTIARQQHLATITRFASISRTMTRVTAVRRRR